MIFRRILVTFILGMFTSAAFAAYGDMDPGTCAPSGVINKAKAAINPKAFWVEMYLDSQNGIETLSGRRLDDQWGGPASHCAIDNRPGTKGYASCMLQMRNMLEYWVKCNRYAKFMCNQSGGHC